MSTGASSIQSIYLKFLQNQIDRTSDAYRRSASGTYGVNDWFRDWTECGADVVGTVWGPWKDILNTEMRWEMRAKPGATEVYESFRFSTPEGLALDTQPFKSSGKQDIDFTAHADSGRRNVFIRIASIDGATSGTAYVGAIVDKAAGKTIASVTLTIE